MTGHWQFFKLMILLCVGLSAEPCDRVSMVQEREGNIGQSGDFSWIGVLHVRLDPEWIATTGIVLIKTNHALANADDVARIPQHIFKSDSRAMFIAARDKPSFVRLASYITHPEYEYSTLNSIAIVELDLDDVDDFPVTPVCLATAKIFSASRYLYLTGFTHENQILEKVFYKIQYLDEKVCKESSNRTELSSQDPIPSAHLCGYAPYSASQCVWDNGMTLLSNDFGYLNLIGFSVHGPGCAAPAHFIDLFPYFHWINSITEITDRVDYRRKDELVPNNRINEFISKNKRKKVAQNIPIHELFTMSESRRQNTIRHDFEAYPFDVDSLKFHLIQPTKDYNTYLIFPFKEKWEKEENSCQLLTVVIYEEVSKVTAVEKMRGTVTYKLSLYDTMYTECTCLRLTVNCDSRSDAILSFKEKINFKEDTYQDDALGERTPEEVFIHFPVPKRGVDTELLRPSFINDNDVLSKKVLNYDLYITFEFTERAELKFEMLAEKPKPTTSTSTEPTRSTDPTKSPERMGSLRATQSTEPVPSATRWPPISTKLKDLPKRRAEMKKQTKPKSHVIKDNRTDNIFEKDEVSVVADVKEVHETYSAVRGEGAPGAAVMAGWLLTAALTTALYVN